MEGTIKEKDGHEYESALNEYVSKIKKQAKMVKYNEATRIILWRYIELYGLLPEFLTDPNPIVREVMQDCYEDLKVLSEIREIELADKKK